MAGGTGAGGGSTGYFEVDSTRLPPGTGFAAWAAAMPYYAVTALDPANFVVRARSWLLPDAIIGEARLSPTRLVRSRELIAADRGDDVGLQLVRAGHYGGDSDGRPYLALPGDICFQDLSRPFEGAGTELHIVTVRMPHSFAGPRISDADLHGLVLRPEQAPLLGAVLAVLPDALAARKAPQAELAALIRDHIAIALGEVEPARGALRPGKLRSVVRRYVDGHLAEPLDVPHLCAALGVSRSALYRAFEREGGVAAFVKRRRLAQLHMLLTDPADRRPIAEVAALHGFVDTSHFTRLFRRTFGYTPGELRARGRESGSTVNDVTRLRRWLIDRD